MMDQYVSHGPAAAATAINQEQVIVCVWAATSANESHLLARIKSAAAFPTGKLRIADEFYEKTTVALIGRGAHAAALRLCASGPGAVSGHPWRNVSEHNRDFYCPRLSCVGKARNIKGRHDCQHCRLAKPKSLRESEAIWTAELAAATAAPDDQQDNTTSTAAADDTSSAGPVPKRPRLANIITATATTSSHPNAKDEKVRITVWAPNDGNDGAVLATNVLAECRGFRGNIDVSDRFQGKAIVTLCGIGAHTAAVHLESLTRPNLPWRNCSKHHREWFCPRLSCVGCNRPNIDTGDPRCRGCGGGRPGSLAESARIWQQELEGSLTNDSSALVLGTATSAGTNSSNIMGSAGSGQAARARAVTPSSAAAPTPAGGIQQVTSIQPMAQLPQQQQPKGEFGIWKGAITKAGYDPTVVLGDNKIFLNKSKDPIKALLMQPNSSAGRIWAFDTNPNSGAKGWIWTDREDTFVDVYLKILPEKRHAYEVIRQTDPCRMVYDLDMYAGDGLNADKDDVAMAMTIIKETHRIINESWPLDGKPSFTDEVLVAHGRSKKSYHIIIKTYDNDGSEVLLKDFQTCKVVANRVNEALGESILVDRKPGHGGKTNPEPASFIDLAIYTKDRPFRLVFSCKITSPDRPFVDGKSSPFGENRDDRTVVLDTLVVPPNANGSEVIDINTDDLAALSPLGDDDESDGGIDDAESQPCERVSTGLVSRMFQNVSSLLSGARNDAPAETVETEPPITDTSVTAPTASSTATSTATIVRPQPKRKSQLSKTDSLVTAHTAASTATAVRPQPKRKRKSQLPNTDTLVTAPTAASTASAVRLQTEYKNESDHPLLDHGRGKIASKVFGRNVPRQFSSLVPWVETLAAGLPNARKVGTAINEARYEYSETEAYVHFTLSRYYASHCHCIGRAHAENNIMISIDLFNGVAYQRCWDVTCKDPNTKARAKRVLSSSPPVGTMPTKEQIDAYERTADMNLF